MFNICTIDHNEFLFDDRIPKVRVEDDGEGQEEIEVSDDPHDVVLLDTSCMPLLVTVSKVSVTTHSILIYSTKSCVQCMGSHSLKLNNKQSEMILLDSVAHLAAVKVSHITFEL